MTDPQKPADDENGTLYEVARAPSQLRAVTALLLGVLALLPKDSQAKAMQNAESRLADDTGALRVLASGLHIPFAIAGKGGKRGAQE
jgi:hypothetical protein